MKEIQFKHRTEKRKIEEAEQGVGGNKKIKCKTLMENGIRLKRIGPTIAALPCKLIKI